MTTQGPGDGWQELRLLVVSMLERHDEDIATLQQKRYQDREDTHERIEERFSALAEMHRGLIKNAKVEILRDLKPPTEVQVANIRGSWQFWATLVTSLGAIVVALVALLK